VSFILKKVTARIRAPNPGEPGVPRDPRVVRALRDLAAAKRDLPLLLVMPIARVPPEIDRDARVLPLRLPDAEALLHALEAELGPSEAPRDPFVRAALGLTLDEARRAFRVARALPDAGEALAQALRQWGQARARRASADRRTLDLFGD
jgi:hypothetical protein